MRIVIVNHCHPDCTHVCGTRAREFAAALTRQSHRVVLMTETLRRDDAGLGAMALPAALAGHDWSQPFRLAIRPKPAPVLEALRAGQLPALLRAPVIAYQYLVRGGMFTDWRDGSRPYWRPLAKAFQPDVVWGIFGNTDAWAIAQGVARTAGCPWVRDVKDQWTAFIPAPFRGTLAKRYGDAVAATSLSEANAGDAARWLPGPSTTVYSGVPSELLAARCDILPTTFTVTLVGAAYETAALATLVGGVERFLAVTGRPVELHYAGTDTVTVEAALAPLRGRCAVHIHGQLTFAAYTALLARSHMNLYVRTPRTGWWHHKLVELLAVRRPILCVPGEIEEARQLVQRMHGWLLAAADSAAVAVALETVWKRKDAPPSEDKTDVLRELTWEAAAAKLAGVLAEAATSAPR